MPFYSAIACCSVSHNGVALVISCPVVQASQARQAHTLQVNHWYSWGSCMNSSVVKIENDQKPHERRKSNAMHDYRNLVYRLFICVILRHNEAHFCKAYRVTLRSWCLDVVTEVGKGRRREAKGGKREARDGEGGRVWDCLQCTDDWLSVSLLTSLLLRHVFWGTTCCNLL